MPDTGGASVGDHDLVRAAGEALGLSMKVASVAVRPGKPTVFGVLAGIFVVLYPYLQAVLGWSGLRSTVALLPMAVTMMAATEDGADAVTDPPASAVAQPG